MGVVVSSSSSFSVPFELWNVLQFFDGFGLLEKSEQSVIFGFGSVRGF